MPDPGVPAWVIAFFAAYLAVSALLFGYGMHAWLMAWLLRRTRGRAPCPPVVGDGALPRVTVQLPVYNERYVARRLIDAAARLDYPRDRLEIQVLDDSTDDTSAIVAAAVASWRDRGTEVVHRRRARRTGYKAGALREGLAEAKGDLVAVFDADFVPPPGFLRETVPWFADPGVGMVQTRWGHLNEDYSILTRAQAVALDGHFLIEQTVRNRIGAFMNFNGTAGVWRRRCILDAGNWQDDTLTEDLDLSYRAQLAGWRFVFLPGVVAPAELPAEVNGLKGQQFRWAKGSVQTAVKLLPRILRAPVTPVQRFQAVVHLTGHAVYPLLLLLGLLSLPAMIVLDRHPDVRPAFAAAAAMIVASLGHPLLYFIARGLRGRRPIEALPLLPVVLACGMGIAVNNTRAFFEGLAGTRGEFNRTPKFALESRRDTWRGKTYRAPVSPWAFAELALAAYAAVALGYALGHGHYLAAPFLALYVAGGVLIGALSLRHTRLFHRGAPTGAPRAQAAS